MNPRDPHAQSAILRAGPKDAARGLVMVHGRGATAADIAGLAQQLAPKDTAIAAPQAAAQSWWPVSFLASDADLSPWLPSALAAVDRAVDGLLAQGLPRDRIGLAGFSQGACLTLEYAARRGGGWHSVVALSGGLIGTGDAPGDAAADRSALFGYSDKLFDYVARLEDVPVLLACHVGDPHIPAARVRRTQQVLSQMGADVRAHLHPGTQHGMGPGDADAVVALWRR